MKGTLHQEKESRVPPAASASGLGCSRPWQAGSWVTPPPAPPRVAVMAVTGRWAMLGGCGELAQEKHLQAVILPRTQRSLSKRSSGVCSERPSSGVTGAQNPGGRRAMSQPCRSEGLWPLEVP